MLLGYSSYPAKATRLFTFVAARHGSLIHAHNRINDNLTGRALIGPPTSLFVIRRPSFPFLERGSSDRRDKSVDPKN